MLKDIFAPFLGASYQTALNGILALISTILVACYVDFWDGDPTTKTAWVTLIPILFIANGIYQGRDDKVTSEEAKKNP